MLKLLILYSMSLYFPHKCYFVNTCHLFHIFHSISHMLKCLILPSMFLSSLFYFPCLKWLLSLILCTSSGRLNQFTLLIHLSNSFSVCGRWLIHLLKDFVFNFGNYFSSIFYLRCRELYRQKSSPESRLLSCVFTGSYFIFPFLRVSTTAPFSPIDDQSAVCSMKERVYSSGWLMIIGKQAAAETQMLYNLIFAS